MEQAPENEGDQQAAVNAFSSLVHTARRAMNAARFAIRTRRL